MNPRQSVHEDMRRDAEEAYRDHQIAGAGDQHWFIRRTRDSAYWGEIAVLRGAHIVIVGDGPKLIVRGGEDFAHDPMAHLQWFAEGGAEYIAGKVVGDGGFTWDEGVATAMLNNMISDAQRADDGDQARDLREFREALCESADEHVWAELLSDDFGDLGFTPDTFGRVIAVDVFMAQAAVRRLLHLLREQG